MGGDTKTFTAPTGGWLAAASTKELVPGRQWFLPNTKPTVEEFEVFQMSEQSDEIEINDPLVRPLGTLGREIESLVRSDQSTVESLA